MLIWLTVLSIGGFVGSLALAVYAVLRLPEDFFDPDPEAARRAAAAHPVRRWTICILRNLLGAALVVLGIVLLFMPGQGLLTLLFGLMLIDFPGKRTVIHKLLARKHVLNSANRWRAKFGKSPLRAPTAEK